MSTATATAACMALRLAESPLDFDGRMTRLVGVHHRRHRDGTASHRMPGAGRTQADSATGICTVHGVEGEVLARRRFAVSGIGTSEPYASVLKRNHAAVHFDHMHRHGPGRSLKVLLGDLDVGRLERPGARSDQWRLTLLPETGVRDHACGRLLAKARVEARRMVRRHCDPSVPSAANHREDLA